MPKEEHIYAVTRAHIHERGLLGRHDIEQLISALDLQEVFNLLSDKGWGSPELPACSPDALVAYEYEKTWALIKELFDDLAPFDVFRVSDDFHNLKAAIKLNFSSSNDSGSSACFLKHGIIPVRQITAAAENHDFSSLPGNMAAAGQNAYLALVHTGNGQMCDIVIDKAALKAIYEEGKKSKSALLFRYAELLVDCADIKSALRCCLMKKNREFIENIISYAGSLDFDALVSAAAGSPQAVYDFVKASPYSEAAEPLQQSLAAFERWRDNRIMELLKPQRNNYFGIEPLAAFILGRENEIRMVRLIFSAKLNNLNNEALRERLREMYV